MSSSRAYTERFAKVFDYIDAHLGEDLSVERLSQVANFSKFHFHRQFSNYSGISVYRYVQMLRLKRASHRLVFDRHARIIEIALEAGFETPESFSRASMTAEVPPNPQGVVNKVIPGGRCAVLRHPGSHERIGESARYLYRAWLPESSEEFRDFPLFFHHLNLKPETPEHELVTDIYLPLK
jgi:DNA gyrase inhibitor GyrI